MRSNSGAGYRGASLYYIIKEFFKLSDKLRKLKLSQGTSFSINDIHIPPSLLWSSLDMDDQAKACLVELEFTEVEIEPLMKFLEEHLRNAPYFELTRAELF